MRKPLFILLGLLPVSLSWALTTQDLDFTPCEKTYIAPDEVFLIENTIHIETENLSGTTSAIYSDFSGLYYKDILEDFEEELAVEEPIRFEDFFDDEIFSIYSDEPLPLFDDEPLVIIPEEPPVIEELPIVILEEILPPIIVQPIDEPIAQTIVEPIVQPIDEPIAQLKPQQPPRRTSSWPYCDKLRSP